MYSKIKNINLKKIFILLILLLFLNSCFWKSEEDIIEEKNEKISSSTKAKKTIRKAKGDGFTVNIPFSWVKVEGNKIPDPRVGKVVLSSQSTQMKNGFINNFIIIKQKLKKEDKSISFSISNHVRSTRKYTNYKLIDYYPIIFPDNDKSMLYIFEARYNSKSTKQKFLQIGKICNKTDAYILTIGINIGRTDYKKYEGLLKTFECDKIIKK